MQKSFYVALAIVLATDVAAEAQLVNPFRPQFCGQCTDGAWIVWVQNLGRQPTPIRNARLWWDDAPLKGFARSNIPSQPSIMVLDGWNTNPNGHVAVVTYVNPNWSRGWYLVWVNQLNWNPTTAGNCAAPIQGGWFAYYPPTSTAWYWNGNSWSRPLPCRGFIR